jgi:hypothetical protein
MTVNELPLETRSLILRRLVPEDVVAVHTLSDEESSRTWLPSQVYRDREEVRVFAVSRSSSLGVESGQTPR